MGSVGGAGAPADLEPSANNPLAGLELGDVDGDVELAPEDLDFVNKNPLEGEFVQSPEDQVDSDLEPFLDDSDFTTRDGFDLTRARRYHLATSPLMTDADDDQGQAQLVVPDMISSIPAAVRAAELAHRDTQQVPLVFVRSGEYRWREGIVLVEKYELDVPPFCELQNGIFINNSTTHWKYESPVPTANSTLKTVRLRLSGDTGSLLWGFWHFDKGASAELSQVQLLTDSGDATGPATVSVMSAAVTFEACAIRSVGGACLRVGEESHVAVRDCELGGLGMRDAERAFVGASVWDSSNCTISRSSLTQGLAHCAALRACNDCHLSLVDSTVDNFGFALSISHSSHVLLEANTFTNLTHGCVSAVDLGTCVCMCVCERARACVYIQRTHTHTHTYLCGVLTGVHPYTHNSLFCKQDSMETVMPS